MSAHDLDYYRQRAAEELVGAELADDPAISQIHRDLARRYREVLERKLPIGDIPEAPKSANEFSRAQL